MSGLSRKELSVITLAFLISLSSAAYVLLAGPAPPAANTIEQGVGVNMPTIEAHDFWFRGTNLTAFFMNLTAALENYTLPGIVMEESVEWGVAYGRTGDWFNHTLPGEPTVIILQMYPTNHTIHGGLLVFPAVYDKTDTQWQLGLYYFNGTQIAEDLLVMYHMRWEPGPD